MPVLRHLANPLACQIIQLADVADNLVKVDDVAAAAARIREEGLFRLLAVDGLYATTSAAGRTSACNQHNTASRGR